RISGLVLPHQYVRGCRGQAANGLALRIDQMPLAALFQVLAAGYECLHVQISPISAKKDEQEEYEIGRLLSRRCAVSSIEQSSPVARIQRSRNGAGVTLSERQVGAVQHHRLARFFDREAY